MTMLIPFQEKLPQISDSAYVAEGAKLIGAVTVDEEASVWFNCVLRADIDEIRVGRRTNIQDGTVVHLDLGQPCLIGEDVTIGHGAIIHGCIIENQALISMGAIILSGAKIGARSVIGAGAVVLEGQEITPDSVVLGVPAKVRRQVSEADLARAKHGVEEYVRLGQMMRCGQSDS